MSAASSVRKAESLADLKPGYVVSSRHQALIDEVIERIKTRVAEEADINLNLDEFDAVETTPEEVLAAAAVLPFLSDRRVIVLKNAQRWSDRQLDAIAAYLEDPAPQTCLIVAHRDSEVTPGKDYKGASLARRSSRLFATAKAANLLLAREGPKWPSEFPEWVVARAAEAGLKMDRSAASYLVEAAGRDLVALAAELDKLSLVYERGALLDRDAVEAMVAPYDRAGLYEYMDALFAGRLTRALSGLATLTIDRSATVVLAAVTDRIKDLIKVKSLKAARHPESRMLQELGLGKGEAWKLKRYVQASSAFDLSSLVELLAWAVEVEALIKRGRLDEQLGLELLTVRVARSAQRPSAA